MTACIAEGEAGCSSAGGNRSVSGNVSLKPGDAFQVPPNTPHGGGEPSKMDLKIGFLDGSGPSRFSA